MIVQDVMSKQVVTCSPNDYVNEVASQQAKEDLEEELSPSSPR